MLRPTAFKTTTALLSSNIPKQRSEQKENSAITVHADSVNQFGRRIVLCPSN